MQGRVNCFGVIWGWGGGCIGIWKAYFKLPFLLADAADVRRGGAGGQAVVVNLVFDTTEVRRLGIEGHVCELQLTTRGFADRAQVQIRPAQMATIPALM